MTDGYVTHQPESTGKKIETETLKAFDPNAVTSATQWVDVQRQRAKILDPVMAEGDPLKAVLVELKLLTYLIAVGLNVNDDLESLRKDFFQTL